MEHVKFKIYLLALLACTVGVTGCSVKAELHLPLAASSSANGGEYVRDTTTPAVVGQHCETRVSLPFYWRVSMDGALENVFKKNPDVVALESVTVTQDTRFYFVRTRVCTEVSGIPLYLSKR